MISYVRCIAFLQFFLLAVRFATIELVHCRAGSLGQHHFHCLRGAIQDLVKDRQLRLAEGRQARNP